MRALTVRQPWAGAIIWLGKDVENRSRNIAGSYRGPLAIHAAKTLDVTASSTWPYPRTPLSCLTFNGDVLGVAELVDVHPCRPGCCSSRWAQADAGVHLVLANAEGLPTPRPARGRLGLWEWDHADLG